MGRIVTRPIEIRDAAHREELRELIRSQVTVTADGCWLWNGWGQTPGGRGRVRLNGEDFYAYRVSYTAWVGPIPDGLLVCHHCDVPACCAPAHLFVGTASDNRRDAIAKNRIRHNPRYGEDHHAVRIPDAVVAEIVRRHFAGETQTALAAEYGVRQSVITKWVSGDSRPNATAGMVRPPRQLKPCGTHAAEERHRRRGELPCAECKAVRAARKRAA